MKELSQNLNSKIEQIKSKIAECEIMALKIKAVNFANFQSFEHAQANYEVGEVYIIKDVGYSVITYKSNVEIRFIVIMPPNKIWLEHWQDVDKHIEIKQGVYLDLYTGKEYKDNLIVKAWQPSHFKAIGKNDLVIKGRVFKN
jgi:hypothetical protein